MSVTTMKTARRRGMGFALLAGVAITSLCAGTAAVAVASETKATMPTVAVEAVPDWIRDRPVPEATKALVEGAQDGIAYLLNDQQYRARADGHDDWFRLASKVVDRSGLESTGQITLTYNPRSRASASPLSASSATARSSTGPRIRNSASSSVKAT